MLHQTSKIAAVAALVLAQAAAQAALISTSPDCHVATLTPTFSACGGSFEGNNNNQLADVTSYISAHGWGAATFAGSSDDASFGPFTGNPQSPTGTLTFDTPQSGPFVLSLKAANQFSLYYFDATNMSVASIGFSTSGTSVNGGGIAQDLSHASLYSVAAVPEPETYALMLAGLGAMGFIGRRRARR